jgi:hypothetical protein
MISRVVLCATLLPLAALAQLQLFLFDGANETSVGSVVNVGAASPGDTVETRFRVRNIGTGPATLQTLSLAGSGFSFSAVPSLPYVIAPYTGSPESEAEFRVTFNPTDIASYSAFLVVNTINVILQGTGTPSAVLTLAGSNVPLAAGAIIDFGPVASSLNKLLGFTLSNPSAIAVTVGTLSVTGGTAFKGPIGVSAPISLAAGQTVSFQIEFQPTSGQASEGALTVDQRSFVLTGQGLNPPLPGASIVFGSKAGLSAQQNNISIPLASASKVSGTGTLTMTFQSSVPGVTNDKTIQFLSGPLLQATVTISVGDTTAKFDGNQSNLVFQTGATAGTLMFTLTLDGGATTAAQASLTIAPAAVNFDSATSVRRFGEVDVSVTGFDNTYTASQLAFTFFDKTGATMQPGVIRVDAASDFRLYFGSTQTGGAFGLLASFPVTGDVSQIVSTDVAITNSVGVTTTQHILIGN